MTHAIRIHATGGPEVLQWETVESASGARPGTHPPNTAIGLNFIEV